MKKKLLFVNGNLNSGGVEKSLVTILRNLDYSKYEVDLLLLQPGEDYLYDIPGEVNIISKDITPIYGPILSTLINNIKLKDWRNFSGRIVLELSNRLGYGILRLWRHILGLTKRYDTAIAFRPGVCTDIVAYCINANRKLAWWHHGNLEIKLSKDRLLKAWLKFDQIVTVSAGTAEMLRSLSDVLTERIKVVPNIIDPKELEAKAEAEANPYNSDVFNIVSVGRLSAEKCIDNAVEAAKILKSKDIACKWHIIGGGDKFVELQSAIKASNLEDEVILHGNKANPYPWIKYADVFVHPSHVESFGIVIIEAMALGTPCVVAESVGPKDFMTTENGMFVGHTPSDLSEAIISLHASEDSGRRFVKHAYMTAAHYSPGNIIKQIDSLL